MIKDADITLLTVIASAGFALAFLAAISTLWPNAPNQQALEHFASALVISFATVFGNLFIFASRLMVRSRSPNRFIDGMTSAFAVIIFALGLFTAVSFLVEGLNTWFSESWVLSGPIIILLRLFLFVPIVWLLVVWGFGRFAKRG